MPMPVFSKWAWIFLTLVLIIASGYWTLVRPFILIADNEYLRQAGPDGRRQLAHRILSLAVPIEYQHDALVILIREGDRSSIPFLIRELARLEAENPGAEVPCFTNHCVDALQNITGAKAGGTSRDWQRWLDGQPP